MKTIENFLKYNKEWAAQISKDNPEYFENLAKGQTPDLLWIGCSDSRVPAEIITGAQPGEMFIHRNIANQVIATDFNCQSVLQYAVNVLKVKHIVVCGHYGCGGVNAALNKQSTNLVITNKWLIHIKNTYRLHQKEIDSFMTKEERIDRLIEFNTIEQVHALSHTSIIQKAWDTQNAPEIHGWVYGIDDGLINGLITIKPGDTIEPIYQYEPEDS